MATSAADSSNLQTEQRSPLANQHASANAEVELTVPNEGLPSVTRTFTLGPQAGTRSGDIDQTAAQQLPAPKKPRKDRTENKAKLENFDKMFEELEVTKGETGNLKHALQIAQLQLDHSKKNEDLLRQQRLTDSESRVKLESDLSSLLSKYEYVYQMVFDLQNELLKSKDKICELSMEKAELIRMNENLMRTQQQPVNLNLINSSTLMPEKVEGMHS